MENEEQKKEIAKQIEELNLKLDKVFASTEKTRKYLLVTMWVSIAFIVLPAIGLLFAIPSFISTYTEVLNF